VLDVEYNVKLAGRLVESAMSGIAALDEAGAGQHPDESGIWATPGVREGLDASRAALADLVDAIDDARDSSSGGALEQTNPADLTDPLTRPGGGGGPLVR
jgi:hypothetical protein